MGEGPGEPLSIRAREVPKFQIETTQRHYRHDAHLPMIDIQLRRAAGPHRSMPLSLQAGQVAFGCGIARCSRFAIPLLGLLIALGNAKSGIIKVGDLFHRKRIPSLRRHFIPAAIVTASASGHPPFYRTALSHHFIAAVLLPHQPPSSDHSRRLHLH